jgi:hypothetical protein
VTYSQATDSPVIDAILQKEQESYPLKKTGYLADFKDI